MEELRQQPLRDRLDQFALIVLEGAELAGMTLELVLPQLLGP